VIGPGTGHIRGVVPRDLLAGIDPSKLSGRNETEMTEDEPWISLRDDGVFVWTSSAGRQWDSVELFRETLKQNLSPEDEAAVFAIIDTLRRLQRQRPKLYPFA